MTVYANDDKLRFKFATEYIDRCTGSFGYGKESKGIRSFRIKIYDAELKERFTRG